MFAPAPVAPDSWDPLSYRLPVMRHAVWYPLGCRVEITSNSADIFHAADSVWGDYPKLTKPVSGRITATVSSGHEELTANRPLPRGQENLISIVDSAANFAVADLSRGFANICLSLNAAKDRPYLLDAFLEPLTYLILGARHFAMVHASCVDLHGRSVLLCGDSGAGKTCLAYMCARSGWTFLSGDATQIVRRSATREVVGRPCSIRFRPNARQLFPELNGFSVSTRANGGKADMDCPTKALGIATALTGRASHLVFLNRAMDVEKATFEPFGRKEAQAWLEQAAFYGDDQVRIEQRETLSSLIDLPVLRLTYSNLWEAERALRRLVEQT